MRGPSECYADGNRGGIISLQGLYEYAGQEVTRATRALGGNQHASSRAAERVLPLLKVRGTRQCGLPRGAAGRPFRSRTGYRFPWGMPIRVEGSFSRKDRSVRLTLFPATG